jgi:hypothetical protein
MGNRIVGEPFHDPEMNQKNHPPDSTRSAVPLIHSDSTVLLFGFFAFQVAIKQ